MINNNIILLNEFSAFGRDRKKKESTAVNVTGSALVAGGAVAATNPAMASVRALSKTRSLNKNKDAINQAADKKNWVAQRRQNSPDLVNDAQEKIKRTQATQKINTDYADAKVKKADMDSWNKKGWKDKIKSSSSNPKKLKMSGKLGVGLGAAGIGLLAGNKILNGNKKKK